MWAGTTRAFACSASFTFELVDEGDDELHDLALLFTWEFSDFLERALHFTDGAWAIGEGLAGAADDEIFDADAEALAMAGKRSERGGLSLHSQKAMLAWGTFRNLASSI